MSRSRLASYAALVALVVSLAACQHYTPLPLSSEAVEHALTPPEAQVLQAEAGTLRHPILKPVVIDESDGLSPDEAAVLAVLLNPGLKAVRDQRGLADAQLLEAGLLPDPQLAASLALPAFGSTQGTTKGFSVGPSWDIASLISRSARVRQASAKRVAVDLDVAWQEWQVAQAAKAAVYHLRALGEEIDLAAQKELRLVENLALTRRALEAGLVTALDEAAAETAGNDAHASLLALQKEAEGQRLELNQLLGIPPATQPELQRGIELPAQLCLPPLDRLLAGLEERRLDLVALRQGYASQEAALHAAVLEQFPKINIGFEGARDTTNVGTLGFGITIDLPILNRNRGRIAVERATRRQLFDEYVNRVFEARIEVAKLLAGIEILNGQIKTALEAEPGLERLVSTYRQAVNLGQADVLSYYNAWNSLTEKRIEVLTLKRQLIQARLALELATGLYRLEEAPQMAAAQPAPEARR